MIVTIDGPAGSGKSTAAKALAKTLGFVFLDTGALYRAVAWKCLQTGTPREESELVVKLTQSMEIVWQEQNLFVDEEEVTTKIREPEVALAASEVALIPAVREELNAIQRRIAETANVVTEGRDQGTIVFPDAECKFFLIADPIQRAKRRHLEELERGLDSSEEEILAQIKDRDDRDMKREIAPLKPAEGATLVDSSVLNADEVVNELERMVREKM